MGGGVSSLSGLAASPSEGVKAARSAPKGSLYARSPDSQALVRGARAVPPSLQPAPRHFGTGRDPPQPTPLGPGEAELRSSSVPYPRMCQKSPTFPPLTGWHRPQHRTCAVKKLGGGPGATRGSNLPGCASVFLAPRASVSRCAVQEVRSEYRAARWMCSRSRRRDDRDGAPAVQSPRRGPGARASRVPRLMSESRAENQTHESVEKLRAIQPSLLEWDGASNPMHSRLTH